MRVYLQLGRLSYNPPETRSLKMIANGENNLMQLAMEQVGMLKEVDGELIHTIRPDHADYASLYSLAMGIYEFMRDQKKITAAELQ
jgi:hypothetical protein